MTPNGTAIRAIREAQKLSIKGLAHLTGLDRGHLSRMERGLVGASPEALTRIATALDVTPADITRGDTVPTKDQIKESPALVPIQGTPEDELRRYTPEEVVQMQLLPFRSARSLRDKAHARELYHHRDGGRVTFTAEDIRRNSAMGARQPITAA